MDHRYRSRTRNSDIETDDVPDGCYPPTVSDSFSHHPTHYGGYGRDEVDSAFLRKGPVLVARGSGPSYQSAKYMQTLDTSSRVSPTSKGDNVFDCGCSHDTPFDSYLLGQIDSGVCDSLDIDLDGLVIEECPPILLREIIRHDSGLPSERDYRTDSGFKNTSLQHEFQYVSGESGYVSGERSIPSVTNHLSRIPEQSSSTQNVIHLKEIPPKSPEVQPSASNGDLFVQTDDGDTILHFAIYTDNQELFNDVITRVTHYKWLNIQNNNQQTALHLAVIQNQPHNVRRLVSWGASVDIRDREGNTALHLACDRLRMECVMALTTHLERRDVKEVPYTVPFQRIPQNQNLLNYDGKTCLHLAAEKAYLPLMPHYHSEQKNYLAIVHNLLNKCGANINAQEGKAGETVLHQAAQAGHAKLTEYLLLTRQINVNAVRYDGSSAHQLASGWRHTKIVAMLEKAGAKVTLDSTDVDEEVMDVESQVENLCSSPKPIVMTSQENEFSYDDIRIGGELLTT